jgi:thrombospondin 2/3/4/5
MQVDESPYFVCRTCPPGFISEDGVHCIDIDECFALKPCDHKVRCENLSPGFRCEKCPTGYHGEHSQGLFMAAVIDQTFQRQRCEDIDECKEGIAQCGPNTNCINNEGSYECECLTGFVRSNSTNGCVPVPGMCPDGVTVCDKNANCRPLGGRRFGCKCKVGYAGDGLKCGTDRDLDGWPDIDLKCTHPLCRQDNCPSIPVRF